VEEEARMLWPVLSDYADWALLAMRLVVALVFFQSGWSHVTRTAERAESIGLSRTFTLFLGVAEIAGALGVAFGVLIQAAAIGLILVMLGAIQKKIFVWKTGFWGEKSPGWHYELLFIVMNLVIVTTAGGSLVLF
jgi:putative oxidoreductase